MLDLPLRLVRPTEGGGRRGVHFAVELQPLPPVQLLDRRLLREGRRRVLPAKTDDDVTFCGRQNRSDREMRNCDLGDETAD